MGIVIDSNTLCSVFDGQNKGHSKFKPVLKWILKNHGKMVYGGTKYNGELLRIRRIRRIVLELKRAGKAKSLSCDEVDKEERRAMRKIVHRSFNDQHIIAIVIVGRCRFICSGDKKSFRFFKRRSLYQKDLRVPKIYSGLSSSRILYA